MILVDSVVSSHQSLLNWLADVPLHELAEASHRVEASEGYLRVFEPLIRTSRSKLA